MVVHVQKNYWIRNIVPQSNRAFRLSMSAENAGPEMQDSKLRN